MHFVSALFYAAMQAARTANLLSIWGDIFFHLEAVICTGELVRLCFALAISLSSHGAFWAQGLKCRWHKWQRQQQEWDPNEQWIGSHPVLMSTLNPEIRSTWCLTFCLSDLWTVFFPHFFAFILSKLCSSLLTFLIWPRHMPCSHGLFFSSRC